MPKAVRPARTPKQLLAEARRAAAVEETLASEIRTAEQMHAHGGPPVSSSLKARHAKATAERVKKEREFEEGRRAWDEYHAAEGAEHALRERERHHATLREVHRNNPDFLRSLGIEPEPEGVPYPEEV